MDAAAIGRVDLGPRAAQAVGAAMQRRMDAIAAAAVDELLASRSCRELREAADEAARLALDAPGRRRRASDEPPELVLPGPA